MDHPVMCGYYCHASGESFIGLAGDHPRTGSFGRYIRRDRFQTGRCDQRHQLHPVVGMADRPGSGLFLQ